MNRFTGRSLVALVAFVSAAFEASAAEPPPSGSILRAAGDAQQRRDRHGNVFDVLRVDVRAQSVEMRFKDSSGRHIANADGLANVYRQRGQTLTFATNGGMFTPAHDPVGLYIEDGRELFPLNRSTGAGNFFLAPNGVFAIAANRAMVLTTAAFASLPPATRASLRFATQSGPMLVVDGRPHPAFREGSVHRTIRSGVGQVSPTVIVFAISETPVTFMELADLFRVEYGCRNALYLDGAISKFWLPALDQKEVTGDFGVLIAVRR